jgi:ferrous iron transport protein A
MVRKRLNEMAYDQEGVVVAIDAKARRQLAGMGVRMGKKIKMITKEPLKGPVVLLIDQARISLGIGIADKVIVEVPG